MTAPAAAARAVLAFDTMCLVHFALVERLDVLREYLVDWECWTTRPVLEEIRAGVGEEPLLATALELDWIDIAQLDTLDEIRCFLKWRNGSVQASAMLERRVCWRPAPDQSSQSLRDITDYSTTAGQPDGAASLTDVVIHVPPSATNLAWPTAAGPLI